MWSKTEDEEECVLIAILRPLPLLVGGGVLLIRGKDDATAHSSPYLDILAIPESSKGSSRGGCYILKINRSLNEPNEFLSMTFPQNKIISTCKRVTSYTECGLYAPSVSSGREETATTDRHTERC